MKTSATLIFSLLFFGYTGTVAQASIFGGIDFPNGASSFADSVISYDPLHSGGLAPTNPDFTDPTKSLGIPNYVSPIGSVSLGSGGLLELSFTDNLLTSSGSASDDLHIFEVGPDVEDTFVAIRPTAATLALLPATAVDANNDGFFEIGKVFGATSSLDIDAVFGGFLAGELTFDAVQLIDDPNEGNNAGETVGADIDSVGAISSVPTVPEPTASIIWSLMGLSAVCIRPRRRG
jgi:hypothetical protein